jgi:hypothetical protein
MEFRIGLTGGGTYVTDTELWEKKNNEAERL